MNQDELRSGFLDESCGLSVTRTAALSDPAFDSVMAERIPNSPKETSDPSGFSTTLIRCFYRTAASAVVQMVEPAEQAPYPFHQLQTFKSKKPLPKPNETRCD